MEQKHANIVAAIEKYGNEKQLTGIIKGLESTVDYLERQNSSLRKQLSNARRDFIVMDEKYSEASGMLSHCTCNLLNSRNDSRGEKEMDDE
jgi:hypothetical protein